MSKARSSSIYFREPQGRRRGVEPVDALGVGSAPAVRDGAPCEKDQREELTLDTAAVTPSVPRGRKRTPDLGMLSEELSSDPEGASAPMLRRGLSSDPEVRAPRCRVAATSQ